MLQVRVSEIVWDTESDGEVHDVDLPSEMVVSVDADMGEDMNVITDLALNEVSDRTGWCVHSSQVSVVSGESA